MFFYIILFSLIGGGFSLIGGLILLHKENLAKKFSIHFISFAAGTLLGAVFFDLLPESAKTGLALQEILKWTLIGFVILFLIEGIFKIHMHHHEEMHHEGHLHSTTTPWMLLLGDTVHNFLDGVAITVAFITSFPLGVITALAIAAHEIPQEIGDFAVMLGSGWKKRKVLFWNIVAASMTTLGAILTFIFQDFVEPRTGYLLALTAGMFIYIAAADLIPEIHHTKREEHDKPSHVISLFLIGIILINFLVRFLE